jgi:flavin-binding protein dodecin
MIVGGRGDVMAGERSEDRLHDRLSPLSGVTNRPMFGGHGLDWGETLCARWKAGVGGDTLALGRTFRHRHLERGIAMAVAKVTELSVTSTKSFEDAIEQGIERAAKTLRNVKSAWVKEMRVSVEDNKVSEYQVHMQVTFVLDE